MGSVPRISAIIVNWNGAGDLATCLPGLKEQSVRPFEIIVVDNGSSDASKATAQQQGVRWLPLERNHGYAPALNRGAAAAVGNVLLFLNNDMRFHCDFVHELCGELMKDESVFAADALQYDWEGKEKVHLATALSLKRLEDGLTVETVPGLFIRQTAPEGPRPVLMASGANIMVRKDMFEALGGFDERMRAGHEDTDICWRAWMRGWKTIFVPSAVCWHRVSRSSRTMEGSAVRIRGTLEGRLIFATKLLPRRYAAAAWRNTVLGLVKDLLTFRWSRAGTRVQVLWGVSRCLPDLFRERRRLFDVAGRTSEDQMRRLLAMGESGR
jgi:GT2 family glycosyltransferase